MKEEVKDGGAITVLSPLLECKEISKHKPELHEVMWPKEEFSEIAPQWDALTDEEIKRKLQFADNAKIQSYKEDVEQKIEEFTDQLESIQETLKSLHHVKEYISQIEKRPQITFDEIAALLGGKGNSRSHQALEENAEENYGEE
jgi:hypothetical protein